MNIEKISEEKSKIKTMGIKSYLNERKVKIKLIWFLTSLFGAFILGAVIF